MRTAAGVSTQASLIPTTLESGETIGLEEVSDGLWNLRYYDTLLGRYDERTISTTGPLPHDLV